VINNHAGGAGGGVSLKGNGMGNGSLVGMVNTTLRGNTAGNNGGGVDATVAFLTDCTVTDNKSALGDGGGISAGELFMTRALVSGNRAYNAGGVNAFTAIVTASTVSGNIAANEAGGIKSFEASLIDTTVQGNTAGVNGGGIRANNLTLTGSTVSDNRAGGNGGGIIAGINTGSATLINSTVTRNTAAGSGGGVFSNGLTLLNTTIARNTSRDGGGVYQDGSNPAVVRNTIIALNHITGGAGPDVFGTFASRGHNVIGDGSGNAGFSGPGDLVGTAQKRLDPKLGPLQNNGGPTQTLALLAGSPAIDHGDSTDVPATDQRGQPRLKDGDGDGHKVVDIGAFEK
jgi:predicted outer membrane repeat protein